jgi:glycosyltransferase involved in cell wall biosynthesis
VPELGRIRRQVRRFAPDVVHAHERLDPRILALAPKVPTVVTVHDPVLHPGQPVPKGLERWLWERARLAWGRRAEAILVHSESLVADVTLRPDQCCTVIPHGLDLLVSPLPVPAKPLVGFFGRLTPYKGLDVLAAAMPRVWETRPEIRVRVTGDGEAPFLLRDPRVQFERRYVPENEIHDLFRKTSLAVLPYIQASQTGVGSIAVGFGIPIVASDVGGLPDLTLDRSYRFPAGDAVTLARRIIQHIDDGSEVRERVLECIAGPRSWDAVAARSIGVYERIARQK